MDLSVCSKKKTNLEHFKHIARFHLIAKKKLQKNNPVNYYYVNGLNTFEYTFFLKYFINISNSEFSVSHHHKCDNTVSPIATI